jgi:hypothetical protein
MSKTTINAIPYTNGTHTLNPGDPCIASVTGMGRGSIRVGVYLGVHKNGGVAMTVNDARRVLVHKETRVPYDYNLQTKEVPYPCVRWSERYGTPAYQAQAEENRKKTSEYHEAIKARQADYEWEDQPYSWRTTLQNNNVFSLAQVAATGMLHN